MFSFLVFFFLAVLSSIILNKAADVIVLVVLEAQIVVAITSIKPTFDGNEVDAGLRSFRRVLESIIVIMRITGILAVYAAESAVVLWCVAEGKVVVR